LPLTALSCTVGEEEEQLTVLFCFQKACRGDDDILLYFVPDMATSGRRLPRSCLGQSPGLALVTSLVRDVSMLTLTPFHHRATSCRPWI